LTIPLYISKIPSVLEYAGIRQNVEVDTMVPIKASGDTGAETKIVNLTKFGKALAGEAPRFEKGKGSGAKEDPSPASSLSLL
jgi:hypothetical protein